MKATLIFAFALYVSFFAPMRLDANSCERVSTADEMNEAEHKSPVKKTKRQSRKNLQNLAIDGIKAPQTATKASIGVGPEDWTRSAPQEVKETMVRWGDWIQSMRDLTSFFTISGRGDSDPRMFNTIHADGKKMLLLAMDGNVEGAREIYARHAIPLEAAVWEKRSASSTMSLLSPNSPEHAALINTLDRANRKIGRHIHGYSIYRKYLIQLEPDIANELISDVRNHLRTERPDLVEHMLENFTREQAWDHYRMHVEGQPNSAPLARQWQILKGEIWDTFAGGARQGINLVGAKGLVEWAARRVPIKTPLLGEVSIAIQDYAAYHNHLSDILSVFTPGKKLTPKQTFESLSKIYSDHGHSGLITFFRIRFTQDLHGGLLEYAKTKHAADRYSKGLNDAYATAQELPDLGVTTIPLSIRKTIGFATAMILTTATWQQLEVGQRLEDSYERAKKEIHELFYPNSTNDEPISENMRLTSTRPTAPRYPSLADVRTVMQALEYAALVTSFEAAQGSPQALQDLNMIRNYSEQVGLR